MVWIYLQLCPRILFQGVSNKEIVILSRQIATLFQAHVSPLRIFRLLSAEIENVYLQNILTKIVDDLQGGSSIARALAAHPTVFSSFYVNLVRAGEESGSLEKSFMYLADYLDRSYEIVSKARNALIIQAFTVQQVRLKLSYFDALYQNDFERQWGSVAYQG